MSADRGAGANLPSGGGKIGLPPRVFLYTLDQIGLMLDLSQRQLTAQYVYFEGRSIGVRHKWFMTARNIAPPDAPPEWRITEREFIRWMRHKGFRYYDTGAVSN